MVSLGVRTHSATFATQIIPFAPTFPAHHTRHRTPWQTTRDPARLTAILSSATPAARPAKPAIEAAHPPSDEATGRAAPTSAAVDATRATAQGRLSAKMSVTAEAGEDKGEAVVTTADGAATIGGLEAEKAETKSAYPTGTTATAHPPKALVTPENPPSTVPTPHALLPALAPLPPALSRRKRPKPTKTSRTLRWQTHDRSLTTWTTTSGRC